MDGTEAPSTSKVIVQCVDPYDLYDSIEPHLSARTPLRNLHWKSPSRPLRSIPLLEVSLTRENTSAGSQPNVRRHQIPGLRQTPYVKLYLVRCDDKGVYKEKVRREVRQWVKAQTSATEGKSSAKAQEDHDAFEWLIVHVVLPDTPAASQPRSAKHLSLETTESTDSVNSKSKWPGKSPSTILDKLKADFNSGSKSPINRVAQVRLVEPKDKSAPLSHSELEEQWQDLVESLKACILRSFDARVAQYEGDIRERESQRSLPGWNFCTFFILKEGLAKGFESVGLLDDALAIYDELSLGLDGLVKEQAQRIDQDDSGALLAFSKETKNLLRSALQSQDAAAASTSGSELLFNLDHIFKADREEFPFDIDRKNYPGLILSNEVSALDLRIYLFARQMEILLRQGRADSAKPGADLNVIADLAERAIQTINLLARNLRLELYNAWGGQEGLSAEELQSQSMVTGNIVSTWEWRACLQILARVLPTLGWGLEYGTGSLHVDAIELSRESNTIPFGQAGADANTRRVSLAVPGRPYPRETSQDRSKRGSLLLDGATNRQSLQSHPGADRLALWISRLALLARHAMEDLESTRPWLIEMKRVARDAGVHHNPHIDSNVDNVPTPDEAQHPPETHPEWMAGLGSRTLRAAASSKPAFFNLYALLSVLAYRMAAGAKSHSTANQILTSLAEMEYAQGNQTIAARYLDRLIGPLPPPVCRPTDGYLLRIYTDCLDQLKRPNEYARCLIGCLYWVSQCRMGALSAGLLARNKSYLDRLFRVAPNLAETTLPLTTLFHISSVSRTISVLEGKDGFALSMVIHSLPGVSTPPVDHIKMRLVSKDGVEPRFLTLTLSGISSIAAAGTKVLLETSVTTHGWYTPDEVEMRLGNLRLLHHFIRTQDEESEDPDVLTRPHSIVAPVLVYPFSRSLEVRITSSPKIHLGQTRRLLVKIRPQANTVEQCKLRLKTATAGLRLNIHDAQLLNGTLPSAALRTAREGDALVLIVDELDSESLTEVEIPYTTEFQSEPSLVLRIDANYETSQGVFTLYGTARVDVILPVTVNVQDVYRSGYLYSRFTISPATLVPLHLVKCHLQDSEAYKAIVGHHSPEPLVVFPKQPASWTVRLVPKHPDAISSTKRMTLCVEFQSLDEAMLDGLEERLTSTVSQTPYAFAARLLAWHLQKRIRAAWTEQDLEMAGLSQEVELWNFNDMDWSAVLCAFDRQVRAELEGWLRTWHSDTKAIQLVPRAALQRQLQLHVDVPPPPVVVMAAFETRQSPGSRGTAAIGQPLLAEVVISLGDGEEKEVEGAFEVAAPSDAWLIGGRRKGNVRLSEQPARIPIVLLPQHLGPALLPVVTVKCRKRIETDAGKGEEWAEVPCEVHNATYGRSVLVTPDFRSTTVEVFGAIPDEGTGRLIASERRTK